MSATVLRFPISLWRPAPATAPTVEYVCRHCFQFVSGLTDDQARRLLEAHISRWHEPAKES